eukprot:3250885-Amphidinium_carterae.1
MAGAMSTWNAKMLNEHPCGVPRLVTLGAERTPDCFQLRALFRQALSMNCVNPRSSPEAWSMAHAFS